MRKKIIVRGPALSLSGYGYQTRFALRALRTYEERFDIYIINTHWGQTGWISEDSEERRWIDGKIAQTAFYLQNKGQFDLSLQITIPQEWEKMAPVNIGYTAGTETTKMSSEWMQASMNMDRIIVTSNHTKYAFDKTEFEATENATGKKKMVKCTIPIEVVNYAVEDYEPIEMNDLNLQTKFNFLTVAHWGPRKNLDSTIMWFVEEFIDFEDVGLVIKTQLKNGSLIDREFTIKKIENMLSKYPDRKCKIYLLHGDLKDGEMVSLYRHDKINAIISTTHGEGFGLPLFEAVYNGIPVVAPDWSGQVDFLYAPVKNKKGKIKNKGLFAKVDYDIKPIEEHHIWEPVLIRGSHWCYPKQGSFKMKLREVYKQYDRYKKSAEILKNHVLENFKKEDIYKKFADNVYEEETFEIEEWLSNLNAEVID